MLYKYEKLIRREASRRVSPDHPFFDDLCQEARIALIGIDKKIDKSLPKKAQSAYVRQYIRWHITKVWHVWLRESLLVSVKSLRDRKADLTKKVDIEDAHLENMGDTRPSPEDIVLEEDLLNKVMQAVQEAAQDERDKKAFEGFIEDLDSRSLGKKLGMSHQGAINVQQRLLGRVRTILRRNARKTNFD